MESGTPVRGNVAISHDGKLVAKQSRDDGTVEIWDRSRSNKPYATRSEFAGPTWMSEPAFSRDGRYLALSHPADGTVTVWDSSSLENRSTERLFSVRQPKLRLAFSPDGAEIAATGPEGWMVLWRLKDKDRDPTRIRAHGRVIFSLLYSADDTRLYTGGGGYLKAWDRTANKQVAGWRFDDWGPVAIAESPDGRSLAMAGKLSTGNVHLLRAPDLRR